MNSFTDNLSSVNDKGTMTDTVLSGVIASDKASQPRYDIPKLSAKQFALFNSFERYILATGPRRSGKTLGVAHKFIRNCFDVPHSRGLLLAKNIKLAKEGGPWSDLVDTVLPEWQQLGYLDLVTRPKLDSQTRSLYCEISNRFGTKTRIYLASLEYDDDAEKLLKSRRFSTIWIAEATNFKKRVVFDTAIQSLRIAGLPYNQHQILLDCNPPDEGQDHWLWKIFWGERLAEIGPDNIQDAKQREAYAKFQKQLKVIEMFIPDNPFISQDEVDELYAQYSYDKDILDRYFYGLWVTSTNDGYFSQQFQPAIHVRGNVQRPNRDEWEVILIPEDTTELYTGSDLGDKNSVTIFACKEKDDKGRSVYSIIDEVVVDNDAVGIEDYTEALFKIVSKWEEFIGKPIQWRHWSDTTAWRHKLTSENHEAALIEQISSRMAQTRQLSRTRTIQLRRVDKYKGSVQDGIKLIKRLLFENRLFVSANCVNTIQMLRSFKPTRTKGTGVEKVPDNMLTHRFDALRYLVSAEEPLEVQMERSRVGRTPGRIISFG